VSLVAGIDPSLVLVCGSRGWTDELAITRRLELLSAEVTTIMHGNARRGADALADEAARTLGYDVCAVPADWKQYGRRAGVIRNSAMLDRCPALVIAFWDGESPGTAHTINEALRLGIKVEVIR
jgi:hypothetical protein